MREKPSGHQNRKRQREAEAAAAAADSAASDSAAAYYSAAADPEAAGPETEELAAAGITAAGCIVVDSTAVGSTAVGSTAVGVATAVGLARSTAMSSAIAGSSVAGSLAAGSLTSCSSFAISSAIASAAFLSTAANPNPDPDPDPDDDPYEGWGSDSGSSGIGHMNETCYHPMDSDEAELSEGIFRSEDKWAREQNRVRAEVMAAKQAAACAQALRFALPTHDRDEVDGWMRDYEIAKLRTSVRNEQYLLSLNLIELSQLSRTEYRLEKALELQSAQQALVHERFGHALATAAISHAIQELYYS